jgi:formylglycine-generating enzyme required for sulfatase activity
MNTAQSIIRSLTLLAIAAGALLAAGPASAQPPPDHGHQFATITHPGNRNAAGAELQYLPDLVVGQVNYEYRIARTETTIRQWIEFGNAYLATHPEAPAIDTELLSGILYAQGRTLRIPNPQNLDSPMKMSWRMAARYTNWLHNDKAMTREAFDSGAYDTSTFTENPDGSYNDQLTRSPGARFWLPTRNEWVKATFYDPNRYGVGQEGYWRAPNGTDTELISGLPWEGGQTSAGPDFPDLPYALPVGSYSTVQSPWGLWDASGGVREWSEDWDSPLPGSHRRHLGSNLANIFAWAIDVPDPIYGGSDRPTGAESSGFRIASSVPSPGLPLVVLLLLTRKSRQC